MANETDVRARVGKYLREQGFFVQPMETGAIANGVPDLWYSKPIRLAAPGIQGLARTGWLELKKVREIPKRATTSLFKSLNHSLDIYQANWINQCIAHGTVANILVAYERRYFFVPGRYADKFNDFTWEDLQKFEVEKDEIARLL